MAEIPWCATCRSSRRSSPLRKRSGDVAASPAFLAAGCRNNAMLGRLELVVDTRRDAHFLATAPGRISGTGVVDHRGVRGVVAVRREAAATCADVEVRIALVDRFGRIQIPVHVLVEAVL